MISGAPRLKLVSGPLHSQELLNERPLSGDLTAIANGWNVGANVHNHVHLERHLVDRAIDKTSRPAALAEWQSLMA
jgi:hypothetical protein